VRSVPVKLLFDNRLAPLPARWRLRWLLITRRLSHSSFAGTSRTEVAAGTPSDSSMFRATAAAGPRSLTTSGSRSSTAGICAVVVGTFSGRSEVVETAGCVEAAESVEVLEVSAFTAEESFEGWAAGVGAAWEEGEESDVLSAGSERAGAGVVDPPGSAVADAASCEDPSEERAGAPVDVVVEAGSGE